MTDNQQQGQEPKPPPQRITAFQDLIAGGIAGSASVCVGHPFDTYKVRLQTSTSSTSFTNTTTAFGGVSSLFRGMAAPLSTAAIVNSIIFSSYGESSRVWDDFFHGVEDKSKGQKEQQKQSPAPPQDHSSWQKTFVCGSFAGAAQALVMCPTEHIKCRLQVQRGVRGKDHLYKGPFDAVVKILNSHGIRGLYRGFISTAWRDVPSYGLYFVVYDYIKNGIMNFIEKEWNNDTTISTTLSKSDDTPSTKSHVWVVASALAGGCAGALSWAAVYPIDIIKTRVQTAPLETPLQQQRIMYVGKYIVDTHGWRYMSRGLGVTLLRAFIFDGIIFPVYEFSLIQLSRYGIGASPDSSQHGDDDI